MIRLVCFDFDGTLVHGFPPEAPFIWRLLHDHHGTPREVVDTARRRFFAGEITYEEWFRHDLLWLCRAGATRAGLVASLADLYPVRGADAVLQVLRSKGIRTAILSGSVDMACAHFFPHRPFDALCLNRFQFDEDGLLVGGESTPFDMGRKADGLRHLADTFGVTLAETAFVGDAGNDVDAARIAGLSIAFNCRDEALAAVAHHVLPAPADDLRRILPFLLGGG